MRPTTTRWLAFGLAGLLLLTAAAPVAAAQGADNAENADGTVAVGSHDIVVRNVVVHVSDLHVVGPGLPDKSVDEAHYSVDEASVTTSDFTITVGDRTILVGPLSLTVEDVGVTLENVSTGSSNR